MAPNAPKGPMVHRQAGSPVRAPPRWPMRDRPEHKPGASGMDLRGGGGWVRPPLLVSHPPPGPAAREPPGVQPSQACGAVEGQKVIQQGSVLGRLFK